MKSDPNAEKKIKFLEYFAVLPIQNLGADYIGVNEDTITDWKKSDPNFSDQIGKLKSEWARDNSRRIRSKEWLMERVMRKEFGTEQKVDLNGKVVIEFIKDKRIDDDNTT